MALMHELRRRLGAAAILCVWSSLALHAQQVPPPSKPAVSKQPRLVVAIVVDQFRYDYLPRFSAQYSSGIKRLLDRGAVFTNARYEHVPTVTAVGHSTFLTGAPPAMSGIVANEWYDRTLRKRVTSVSDDNTKLLGANGSGSSP